MGGIFGSSGGSVKFPCCIFFFLFDVQWCFLLMYILFFPPLPRRSPHPLCFFSHTTQHIGVSLMRIRDYVSGLTVYGSLMQNDGIWKSERRRTHDQGVFDLSLFFYRKYSLITPIPSSLSRYRIRSDILSRGVSLSWNDSDPPVAVIQFNRLSLFPISHSLSLSHTLTFSCRVRDYAS